MPMRPLLSTSGLLWVTDSTTQTKVQEALEKITRNHETNQPPNHLNHNPTTTNVKPDHR